MKNDGIESPGSDLLVTIGRAGEPAAAFPDGDEVWVGVSRMDEPATVVEELVGHLTPEELARAARYKIGRAREQFAICRGLLRRLLGCRLGMAPAEVPIVYTGAGKPVLAHPAGGLHFNISHTDGLALFALARRPIGIDVERTRAVANLEGLVERFFSPAERTAYEELPAGLRTTAFFRGWTCKEAVLKTRGLSVTLLDEFDVELHPARPAGLLAARHPDILDASWQLRTLQISEGYSASLAVCYQQEPQ